MNGKGQGKIVPLHPVKILGVRRYSSGMLVCDPDGCKWSSPGPPLAVE